MPATPYLTAADLRVGGGRVLDRGDRFSDEDLEALVAEFEDLIERECGVAFTERDAVATLSPVAYSRHLILPHVKVAAPTAVVVDDVAFTSTELADLVVWADLGILERPVGWYGTQVVVTYTHGYETPPVAVLRACREFVRAKATKGSSNAPRDAAGPAGVDGTVYPTATTQPTGVREVDRIIANLEHHDTPSLA